MMSSPFAYTRSDLPTVAPSSVDEAAEAVRSAAANKKAVLARGGGTKWHGGTLPTADAVILSTTNLCGVLEYDPGELTFTARAGTPIGDIQAALADKGQYLPFDPPFASAGATLGGTVAAGLSGPRRMRYGGLRDFVLGVDYLNGEGNLVRSGGKVVKNAAGYDFPKLFCGSLGTLGVIVQVSFKVFPAPQANTTLLIGLPDAPAVQMALRAVSRSGIEISAAESWPSGTLAQVPAVQGNYVVAILIEGAAQSLEPRVQSLRTLIPDAIATTVLEQVQADVLWESLRDLAWLHDDETAARVYLTPNQVVDLDSRLQGVQARRVYTLAGNACWTAFQGSPSQLTPVLQSLGLRAVIWRASEPTPEIIPTLPGLGMVKRVKAAFDPANVFYPGRYATG